MSTDRRAQIWSLLAALAGCSAGGARWDAHAVVRPAGGGWDQAEIRIQGSRPAGADVGDACDGTIAVTERGTTRALSIRMAALRTIVTATTPAGLVPAGGALDAAALKAAGPALSSAEIDELLRMIEGACAGPKVGFPATPGLVVLVADQRYR